MWFVHYSHQYTTFYNKHNQWLLLFNIFNLNCNIKLQLLQIARSVVCVRVFVCFLCMRQAITVTNANMTCSQIHTHRECENIISDEAKVTVGKFKWKRVKKPHLPIKHYYILSTKGIIAQKYRNGESDRAQSSGWKSGRNRNNAGKKARTAMNKYN